MSFVRTVPVSDAQAEAAGIDVAGYRQLLPRSVVASLRWTDLTTSSALPRTQPVSGYEALTDVAVSVTTGDWTLTFFDYPNDATSLDCSYVHFEDAYALGAEVSLATRDGALQAVLPGSVVAAAGALSVAADANTTRAPLAQLNARVDLADATGTLRIEPPAMLPHASLDLGLSYWGDTLRGGFALSFRGGANTPDDSPPAVDQALVARFPADGCGDVPPVPLDRPDQRLGGRTPAAVLDDLRSAASAGAPVHWTETGNEATARLEIGTPEQACFDNVDRLINIPFRLSTSDGVLAWSDTGRVDLGTDPSTDTEGAGQRVRLALDREFTPAAAIWSGDFSSLAVGPHTERAFVRFRADYPATSAEASSADGSSPEVASPEPARVLFELARVSSCPGDDAACQAAARDSAITCLVARPSTDCVYATF
jgi:hypothetical protein